MRRCGSLHSTQVDDAGAQALAEALRGQSGLTTLALKFTASRVGRDGVQARVVVFSRSRILIA